MQPSREALEKLRSLVSSAKVKPVVDSVFAMEDALKAYEKVLSHRAAGKVAVQVVLGIHDASVDDRKLARSL